MQGAADLRSAAMEPHALLARLAVTIRNDIAPEVGDGFARTQAFMASVVLDKLARQLELAADHAALEHAEIAALVVDLDGLLTGADAASVRAAVVALPTSDPTAGLAALVETVHRGRPDLGDARTDELLSRIRTVLRSRVDRQMAYAS